MNGNTKKSTSKVEMLDVEDDEERLARLQNLLENVDSEPSLSSRSTAPSQQSYNPIQFPLQQSSSSKPHFVPKSEVLSRLESFLPQFAESNAELLKRAQSDPTSVNIENIAEDQENYIEMNLGLGVFETKRKRKKGQKAGASTSASSGTDADTNMDSHSDESGNDNDEIHTSDSSASTSRSSSRSDNDSNESDKASNPTSSSKSSSEEASLSSPSSSASSLSTS